MQSLSQYSFYTYNDVQVPEIKKVDKLYEQELTNVIIVPVNQNIVEGAYTEQGRIINNTGRRRLGYKGYCNPNEKIELPKTKLQYKGKSIYIGYLMFHYGHMLVDGSIRLWDVIDSCTQYEHIVCITPNNNTNIPQYYYEFFSMLKLDISKLLVVTTVSSFEHMVIPDISYLSKSEDGFYVCNMFEKVFNVAIKNVLDNQIECSPSYEKIFFTRKDYVNHSGRYEYGDDLINKVFLNNGYMIIDPSSLTTIQKIKMLNGCKILASGVGTSAHNAIWAEKLEQLFILNRYPVDINQHQVAIDSLKNYKVTIVDIYDKKSVKDLSRVYITNELIKFLNEHSMNLGLSRSYIFIKQTQSKVMFALCRGYMFIKSYLLKIVRVGKK